MHVSPKVIFRTMEFSFRSPPAIPPGGRRQDLHRHARAQVDGIATLWYDVANVFLIDERQVFLVGLRRMRYAAVVDHFHRELTEDGQQAADVVGMRVRGDQYVDHIYAMAFQVRGYRRSGLDRAAVHQHRPVAVLHQDGIALADVEEVHLEAAAYIPGRRERRNRGRGRALWLIRGLLQV